MGRNQWTEAEYKEDTTPTSLKEKERERAGSRESIDERRSGGEVQMSEVSRSYAG